MEYNVNGIQCLLFLLMSRIIPPSCTMGAPTHMGIPEPKDVYPEERFQSAIVAVMRDVLNASGQKFVLLEGFGLDIAIFIATPYGSIARFIEVKAFGAQRMGGVGFGNGRGVGIQVDLLLTHDNCLSLLDPNSALDLCRRNTGDKVATLLLIHVRESKGWSNGRRGSREAKQLAYFCI